MSISDRPVRIGCYSAFWGDSVAAAVQLVEHEGKNLNYLVADYLAEITMGILAARRQRRIMMGKDTDRGADYIAEFLTLALSKILPDIARNGTKVITNAGGLDPVGCKKAIEALLNKMGIQNIKVAAVWGDDVLSDKEDRTLGAFKGAHPFSTLSVTEHNLDADRLPSNDEPIVSLNAYLGAKGIAAALDEGAHIVVTEPNKEKHTSEGNDKKVMYGASCMQGWRANMEDAHTALTSYANTGASFFAVFDGHGGSQVASYSGKTLYKKIMNSPAFEKGRYRETIRSGYYAIDEELKRGTAM
ncbi:hypothetical protein RMATCC62417_12714 [Rhizopus microsporus]|nr:hypothetical protein RMATCC62417_12714 [Rhizopus microsporus]